MYIYLPCEIQILYLLLYRLFSPNYWNLLYLMTLHCVKDGGSREVHLLENMEFLQDLNHRVAQIVYRVGCNSVGELLNCLMDDISQSFIEESREVMFKQATLRYIDILDNMADYSQYDEVPVLVLKNRRKGEQQLKKTCNSKDLLDFVWYYSITFTRSNTSFKISLYCMLFRSLSNHSNQAWPQALPRESLRTANNHDVVMMTYARELCGSDTCDT